MVKGGKSASRTFHFVEPDRGVLSLILFKDELKCHKCGIIPRSGPIFRSKSLKICCQNCSDHCNHNSEDRDFLAEKLIATCHFLCRNHTNWCIVEELKIEVIINNI
jgi:hypothetical protein